MPWDYIISETEKEPHMADALIDERQTIISWAVAGTRQLFARKGFLEPARSQQTKLQWRISNDPILEFIGLCDVNAWTQVTELHAMYRSWAEENNRKLYTVREYGLRLQYHGVERIRRSAGMFYKLEYR